MNRERSRSPRTESNLEHIKSLVLQREQARCSKDFGHADEIRRQLSSLGVELWDKEKLWKQEATGLSGIIIGFFGDRAPSDLEISALCIQREKARLKKDFVLSDSIRDELKQRGVELYDKEREWRVNADGRRGPIPTFNEVDKGLVKPGRQTTPARIPTAPGFGGPPTPSFGNSAAPVPGYGMNTSVGYGNLGAPAPIPADLQAAILQVASYAQNQGNPSLASQIMALGNSPGNGMYSANGMNDMSGMKYGMNSTLGHEPESTKVLNLIRQYASSNQRASYEEVVWMVQTREELRQMKNFSLSDTLRNEMKKIGIELFEKEKRWQTVHGDSGPIPMWDGK